MGTGGAGRWVARGDLAALSGGWRHPSATRPLFSLPRSARTSLHNPLILHGDIPSDSSGIK